MRRYLETFFIWFIILPVTVHSFIRVPPIKIPVPRNIECYSSRSPILQNDYQLCVFRVYYGDLQLGRRMEFTTRDGMWYTNTFHQLLKRCKGLPENSDIGSAYCPPLPYETHVNMSICICAESYCNIDWGTCETSNRKMSSLDPLKLIWDDLSKPVACAGTDSLTLLPKQCIEHPWIDRTKCVNYINTNSVLCSINTIEGAVTKEALTVDDYERALARIYHKIRFGGNTISINISKSYFYVSHQTPFTEDVTCTCNTFNNCNLDTFSCKALNAENARRASLTSTIRTSVTTESLPLIPKAIATQLKTNGSGLNMSIDFLKPHTIEQIDDDKSLDDSEQSIDLATATKDTDDTSQDADKEDTAEEKSPKGHTDSKYVLSMGIMVGVVVAVVIAIIVLIGFRIGKYDGRGPYQLVPHEA